LISNKLSIEDLELKGKRVLIRVDFNVSLKILLFWKWI